MKKLVPKKPPPWSWIAKAFAKDRPKESVILKRFIKTNPGENHVKE